MADTSRTSGSQPLSREAPIMRDLRNLKELPPGRVVSRCWVLHQSTQFLQPPPFGKVWVEVGPEVIPGGLRFFNISKTAREEGTWELMVLNRLVTQGGLLLLPISFQELLVWLGTEVLAGNISLPYYPRVANGP